MSNQASFFSYACRARSAEERELVGVEGCEEESSRGEERDLRSGVVPAVEVEVEVAEGGAKNGNEEESGLPLWPCVSVLTVGDDGGVAVDGKEDDDG